MSLFSKTSAWTDDDLDQAAKNFRDFEVVGVIPSDEQQKIQTPAKKTTVELHKKQIDDWVYRLKSVADEVGDADLLAAESDLLDIRDELDRLLD